MVDWQFGFKKEGAPKRPKHSAIEIARMLNISTAALATALAQEGAPPPAFMGRKKAINGGRHVCIRYYDAKTIINWYKNIFPLQQQARVQAQKERRKKRTGIGDQP